MTREQYKETLQRGCFDPAYRDVRLFKSYFFSLHWQKVRAQQLQREPFCRCGELAGHVHHLKYRFFEEKSWHLQSCCPECHREIHGGFF